MSFIWKLASSFQKNHKKQNDIKVRKAILPEECTFIKPKKTLKRNCNCQNSSYNEPLKSFNSFEVLHHKTIPNNTNYSKEDNITQNKIRSNNINFKEKGRPQVVVNEFPERQHIFQRRKIVPIERLYSQAKNPRVYNANNIIVFSDSIASFTGKITLNFNNELKEGRARFKYFPCATSNDLLFYIEPTLGEGQLDAAIFT